MAGEARRPSGADDEEPADELFRTLSAPAAVNRDDPPADKPATYLLEDRDVQKPKYGLEDIETLSEEDQCQHPMEWLAPTPPAPVAMPPTEPAATDTTTVSPVCPSMTSLTMPALLPAVMGTMPMPMVASVPAAPLPALPLQHIDTTSISIPVPLPAVMPLPLPIPLPGTASVGGGDIPVVVGTATPAGLPPALGLAEPGPSGITCQPGLMEGPAPLPPGAQFVQLHPSVAPQGGFCGAMPSMGVPLAVFPHPAPVCIPMPPACYDAGGPASQPLTCQNTPIDLGSSPASLTCSAAAFSPSCPATFMSSTSKAGFSKFGTAPPLSPQTSPSGAATGRRQWGTNTAGGARTEALKDDQDQRQRRYLTVKPTTSMSLSQAGPLFGTEHQFHNETARMGKLSTDCRHFTKEEYEGRLSVITEAEVHSQGEMRYALQFTHGVLSSADGVGFIFSPKLPCPKNIQRIVSIFVNRTGRICVRAHSEVIKSGIAVKQFEIGDWVEVTMNLDDQTADFKVWPAKGGLASCASLSYGQALASLRMEIPILPKASSGYFACVVKHQGVGISLGS